MFAIDSRKSFWNFPPRSSAMTNDSQDVQLKSADSAEIVQASAEVASSTTDTLDTASKNLTMTVEATPGGANSAFHAVAPRHKIGSDSGRHSHKT